MTKRSEQCGCKVFRPVDEVTESHWAESDGDIEYCHLHSLAGEMKAMLKTVHFEGAGLHYEAIADLLRRAQDKT